MIQTCFNCVAGLHISNESSSDPREQVNERIQPLLTYEKVGIRGGGAVLLLEELVEEGGETRDDRGEAALSKHQEDEEGVEEQLEEDLWESCRETARKKYFSNVVLISAIHTAKYPTFRLFPVG